MDITRKNLLALVKTNLTQLDLKVTELERKAGVPKDTVRDFIRGKTQILRADKLQKIMRVLQPEARVPVAGYVGDETVITFAPTDLFVDCPPGLEPHDVTAIRVEADSMRPVFLPGWVIYYSNYADVPVSPMKGGWQVPYNTETAKAKKPGARTLVQDFASFIGKPCVVKTRSGSLMLRTLKPGSADGLFNLVSYNCDDIRDAQLEWAAKIIFIKTE